MSPHVEPLPAPYSDTLTAMQRLIVLRCLRPDKVCASLCVCVYVCVCVCVFVCVHVCACVLC